MSLIKQIASNYMLSNSHLARLLPHPKYCRPGRERAGNFIGHIPFATNRYAHAARETCKTLAGS